jgi:hypothetical protein
LNEYQERVLRWRNNIILFVEEALRWPEKGWSLTQQQRDGLRAVQSLVEVRLKRSRGETLNSREEKIVKKMGISIMSGQGTGKDTTLSIVILWFLYCFPFPKALCTATSRNQLKDVLWSEIAKQLRGTFIEDRFVWQSDKVYLKEHQGKEWFAVARTTNTKATPEQQAETLAGRHQDYMLFVIDEASGVPDPVFRPIEGGATGMCNFTVMAFNPTRRNGYAIDSHGKNRNDWICLQWDAEESEIVTREQISRMEEKYGRDSNVFRVRVKGLPPVAEEDVLIPWDWVMAAVDRDIEVDEGAPRKLSVDVGGGADISAICPRQGGVVYDYFTSNSPDTMVLAGKVMDVAYEFEPKAIMVDVIGLGNGVYCRLKELNTPFRIYAVDFRRKAYRLDKFAKMRDELWWRTRQEFEEGVISIPNDDELIGELTSIKYTYESSGKIKIEDKRDMRRRGVPSPNRADALVLSNHLKDRTLRGSSDIYRGFHHVKQTKHHRSVSSGRGFMAA